ncbi:MAG: hypothetical protein FJ257_01320 [Phycisphaerae bacterium]|nr:hypothetical protein [Phycisphaerae bacterium]
MANSDPRTSVQVVFVGRQPPPPSIASLLRADHVRHERHPLRALAVLGQCELAARSGGTWGAPRTERVALVIGEELPGVDRLREAVERHLHDVEVWLAVGGPPRRVTTVPADQPARPSGASTSDDATPRRLVSAEEIRMLLGDARTPDAEPPR